MSPRSGALYFVVLLILLLPTRPAQAYIDPGSGSYIIQIVIGAVLAGFYLLSSFWRNLVAKIRNLFSRKVKKVPEADESK